MSHVKTVRIKPSHPPSQGEYVEINEADFDPEKHELVGAAEAPVDAAADSAEPPARRGPGRPRKIDSAEG